VVLRGGKRANWAIAALLGSISMQGLTMRKLTILILVAFAVVFPAAAHAQSETDRLREALRSATVQLRALEDQRGALQAKEVEAERQRDLLQKQIDVYKAQVKGTEQAYQKAVEDFNQRLADRDDALEKWKAAYEDAASVARGKDAERAKFESEATALKASNKSCEAKNMQLAKVGGEMLNKLNSTTLLDFFAAREPLIGVKRVELQNLLQDYQDKIQDQKVKP
jgi:chromosome segregation ATPase